MTWLAISARPYVKDPQFINEVGPKALFFTVIAVSTVRTAGWIVLATSSNAF